MPPQITCPYCGNTIGLENRKEVDFQKIIDALGKSPRTFTELLAMTNLPRKTLSLRLKELSASGSITKDGGYHLNPSIVSANRVFGKKNGNGKMNQTILHIKKHVQWIPVALIICLVVVAFGSALMVSPPAPAPASNPTGLTASFFITPSSNIVAGKTLTFYAGLSSASDGPVTEAWDFGDGSLVAYGGIVAHTYLAQGNYTVILTVEDSHGFITKAQGTVDVSASPFSLTPINFTISPNPNMINSGWEDQWIVNRTLTFDASAFNQSSGYKPDYSWSFGDGSNTSWTPMPVATHAYAHAGTFNATLTVLNLEGNVQSITEPVQILPMPVTKIYVGQLPAQYQVGETMTLSVFISNVTDLYTWQAGMTFNPSVLQCVTTTAPDNTKTNVTETAFVEGSFLKSGGDTWWLTGPLNNSAGTIGAYGCSLYGPNPGVNGSGVLFTVSFKVIGEGPLNIHLTDVILFSANGTDTEIPVYVVS
ncbi:MAG TPA: PKD domain-containing protein [Candidatus Bathyarchaeia archaeon]|nr:PKD domain-containing protein [Candidatus Bathyarchaeia archaeon]